MLAWHGNRFFFFEKSLHYQYIYRNSNNDVGKVLFQTCWPEIISSYFPLFESSTIARPYQSVFIVTFIPIVVLH